MGHYAKVEGDKVSSVIVADQEFIDNFFDGTSGRWVKTSYNTRGGVHYDPNTMAPSADQTKALRKNFAAVGFTYNKELDAFIPPKPYPSWVLNETSCLWEAPSAIPDTENGYYWDEPSLSWVEVD